MTDIQRSTTRARSKLAMLAAGALAAAFLVAVPVSAAPPSNDAIASPRIVDTFPYADGPTDTTEATTGPTDPGFCYDPGVGIDRATVWYRFAPVSSGSYAVDTFGSDYDTTLYVGTPNGAGGIDVIDCNDDVGGVQSLVTWDATANTTYLIMVGTCCGGGGEPGGGSLIVHVGPPPEPPTLSIELSSKATFTRAGSAIVTGTATCTGASTTYVSVEVTQRVGRFLVRGYGDAEVDCSEDGSPWSLEASGQTGTFSGGRAEVTAWGFLCTFDCVESVASATVQLRH